MQIETINIPLSQLVRSPFNVRKKEAGELESLAASIDAHSIIHNLVVHPVHVKGRSKKYGVADGERRRQALE
jgi:ParB-like chromosome segregation protein Spo0J